MIGRPFGPLARDVPAIGQGTWNVPVRGAPANEAKRALRRGIELGMVHIDTAEMYGDGAAEELVGDAIRGLPREQLFVVSKVLPSNASFDGTIRACEQSLQRLGVDYLDCYPAALARQSFRWRRRCARSNGSSPTARPARSASATSTSPIWKKRGARSNASRWPAIRSSTISASGRSRSTSWRTVARMRSRWSATRRSVAATGPTGPAPQCWMRSRANTVRRRGKSSLAFLTRDRDVFVIPKASQVAHIEENAAAADLRLDADDVAAIDRAFPIRRRRGGLPTL